MLLYRVVPDQYGMVIDKYDKKNAFNAKGLTTEDLFYKLGYFNISDHAPYFYTENVDDENKCVSFFISPWDALHSFIDIEGDKGKLDNDITSYFSNKAVRIQEYDIPDEIIDLGERYTEERGDAYKCLYTTSRDVIKIPVNILVGDNEPCKLDEELISELSTLAFMEGNETLDKLAEIVYRDDEKLNKERLCVQKRTKFYFKYQFLKDEIREKIDKLRFNNAGVFFKSDYITSRELFITLDDYLKIRERELFKPLFETGMFTLDNYHEYKDKNKILLHK